MWANRSPLGIPFHFGCARENVCVCVCLGATVFMRVVNLLESAATQLLAIDMFEYMPVYCVHWNIVCIMRWASLFHSLSALPSHFLCADTFIDFYKLTVSNTQRTHTHPAHNHSIDEWLQCTRQNAARLYAERSRSRQRPKKIYCILWISTSVFVGTAPFSKRWDYVCILCLSVHAATSRSESARHREGGGQRGQHQLLRYNIYSILPMFYEYIGDGVGHFVFLYDLPFGTRK